MAWCLRPLTSWSKMRLYHFWNFVKSSLGELSRPGPRGFLVWSAAASEGFRSLLAGFIMKLVWDGIWFWWCLNVQSIGPERRQYICVLHDTTNIQNWCVLQSPQLSVSPPLPSMNTTHFLFILGSLPALLASELGLEKYTCYLGRYW